MVFVGPVDLASLAWQLVLAGARALFGHLIGPRAARIIGIVASLLVTVLGATERACHRSASASSSRAQA